MGILIFLLRCTSHTNSKLTASPPNQDALIDVALGLGAPLSKLILNMPAFGNSFNLMDVEKNLPGSAVTSSQPSTTTYQQVIMTPIGPIPYQEGSAETYSVKIRP